MKVSKFCLTVLLGAASLGLGNAALANTIDNNIILVTCEFSTSPPGESVGFIEISSEKTKKVSTCTDALNHVLQKGWDIQSVNPLTGTSSTRILVYTIKYYGTDY